MRKTQKTIQVVLQEMCEHHLSNKKWNTASLYSSVIIKINNFSNGKDVLIDAITPTWLKSFESYLRSIGNCWNTVSTYMRILKAAYKEAAMNGYTKFRPLLFNKVYRGVVSDRQNALDVHDMEKLIKHCFSQSDILKPKLQETLQYFVLMFLLRGMPFVDLVYLKRNELKRNVISYRRMKTGRPLAVEVEDPAKHLLQILVNHDESSPYLFPFLHHADGTKEAYKEYKTILKGFNNRLSTIGKALGISQKITTYTARHTWVTIAFTCNINTAVISQSVGHSSIKVTEIYLKPFQQKAINDANKLVIQSVMS